MSAPSRPLEMKRDWLDWPFFGESHRAFAGELDRFVASGETSAVDHEDVDKSCRDLARALGEAGIHPVAVKTPDGEEHQPA